MLSRRLLLTGTAGVAGSVALGGCEVDEHRPSISGGDGPSPPPFPRTVAHRFGGTTLAARPRRVVALGDGDADVLVALGIVPVAVRTALGPWATTGRLSGTPPVLPADVGTVGALRPDLVVEVRAARSGAGPAGDRAAWQRWNDVVPTLVAPASDPSPGRLPMPTRWREQARAIAAAVLDDRYAAAEALVSEVESAVAAAADPAFRGRSVCVAVASGDGFDAYVRDDDRVALLESIGFRNAERIEATEPRSYQVDRFHTRIGRAEADWMTADLTLVLAPGRGAELRADPALRGLPGLLVVDDAELVAAVGVGTVLSIPYALKRLVPLIRDSL